LIKSLKLRPTICAFAVVSLSACASTPEPVIGLSASTPRSDLGQADFSVTRSTKYLLRASDSISVNVFREPDFSLDNVRVGVEGNVSLPMLGSIPAAGLTAAEFEQDVTRRLAAAGLRNPLVAVNISEYASHLVTVEGAVNRPGVYAFQPGSRLSAAIAMGGGTGRTAARDQVAVFRESGEGVMVAKFDYSQINQGIMLDPVLEPGDRLVVGTDGMSVFWQDLLTALPAFGVFATIGVNALDND
jgi:polysaccharide export outer membrane protein